MLVKGRHLVGNWGDCTSSMNPTCSVGERVGTISWKLACGANAPQLTALETAPEQSPSCWRTSEGYTPGIQFGQYLQPILSLVVYCKRKVALQSRFGTSTRPWEDFLEVTQFWRE